MKKTETYSNIHLNYKVWLSDEGGESLLGDDKWQLLKAVERLGSLKAAADSLKISYRKAWGDIQTAEVKLGFQLLGKIRGGKEGGNSFLTDEGKRFIQAYDEFHREFSDSVEHVIVKFKRTLKRKL